MCYIVSVTCAFLCAAVDVYITLQRDAILLRVYMLFSCKFNHNFSNLICVLIARIDKCTLSIIISLLQEAKNRQRLILEFTVNGLQLMYA